MPPTNFTKEIRSLVAEDRLEEAIAILNQQPFNQSDQHTLTMLENRFHRIQREVQRGTASKADADQEYSKIGSGLLSLVQGTPQATSFSASPLPASVLWAGAGIGLLALLIMLALDLQQPKGPTNSTQGANSPIINAGGDVDYRQEPQPIQVPENLRQHVTDTTLLDTTP